MCDLSTRFQEVVSSIFVMYNEYEYLSFSKKRFCSILKPKVLICKGKYVYFENPNFRIEWPGRWSGCTCFGNILTNGLVTGRRNQASLIWLSWSKFTFFNLRFMTPKTEKSKTNKNGNHLSGQLKASKQIYTTIVLSKMAISFHRSFQIKIHK